MHRRVICISRVTGAGGEDVGRLVAEKLGLRYLDEEIIARAAAKGGVSAADVADAERRRSALNRLLTELGRGLGAEASAVAGIDPIAADEKTPQHLQQLLIDVLEEAAGLGDVVVAARGASFALSGRPDVLRVHVTASPDTRARRLCESVGLELKQSKKALRDADGARADYLRRFYSVAAELPTHYDLVLNTDRLSNSDAAEVVAQAAR